MTTPSLPTTSSAPGLTAVSPQNAAAVADILVDDRAGCIAPIGFAVIAAAGMFAAGAPAVGVNPANATAFVAAIVLGGAGFIVVPLLVARRRAQRKLLALGLSAADIAWARRRTRGLRAALGGRSRENAHAAIVAALVDAEQLDRTP